MKTSFLTFLFTLFIVGFFSSCRDNNSNTTAPKNVILLIGDGMSTPQIYATMIATNKTLSFEQFQYTGLVKTYSKNKRITDSAASGTAIATGTKTDNGMIGVNSDGQPVPSMLELFADKGKRTGIVVTSYVSHATPASFVAKNTNRNSYYEIANDIATTDKLNFLAGGGRKHFNHGPDSLNLIKEMQSQGWMVYDTLTEVRSLNDDKIAVLIEGGHLSPYPSRGNFLPDAVDMALQNLSSDPDGFFLMVEGSQIDFAGHNNDSVYLINEMIDFDNTINRVLEFAKKNPQTLVLVTADHETGGLSIVDPEGKYTKTHFRWSTGSHSPLLVPIFAYGPCAEKFSGIMENSDIIDIIMSVTR